jgi:hypothetical protein
MDFRNGEREFLVANRAVRIDEDGIERYVGLTETESVDYLMLSRANDAGGLGGDDKEKYLHLHSKHEPERQAYVKGEKSLNAFQKP